MPPPVNAPVIAPVCPSTFSDTDPVPTETRETGSVPPSDGSEEARRLSAMTPRSGGRTSVLGPLPRAIPGERAPFSLVRTESRRVGGHSVDFHYDIPGYPANDPRLACVPNGSEVTVNGTRFVMVEAGGEHGGRYLVRADSPSLRHFRTEGGEVRSGVTARPTE